MDCFCSKPRSVHCKIILLDEQELIHEVQNTCTGQAILDVVFRHLNLLETAYFGLRYLDQNSQTHWLDPAKRLNKQFKGTDPYTLYFGVKFYAADPCKLLEEITRYQFFLQGKQDVLQGRLPVSFELAAELGAYIVQSELGDYDPRRHSPGYVSEFRFVSNQTIELENRIAELHKTLVGQLPSVAELTYLDKIKWLEMYGVDLHPVLGENNVDYFLGLTPSGIIVLRNKNTVGNYYWPRISKIYFKGRFFMLRVTDKNNDENTYGFETPSKAACKHLWKCCVEHHEFFRLVQVSPSSPITFTRSSTLRYSGKKEKQPVEDDSQLKVRSSPAFTRLPSRRYQRRNVEGTGVQMPESIAEPYQAQEMKHVSIPQPAQIFDSAYRATCKISTRHRSDSPRSTRSAPWTQPHSKGLYNNNNNSNPPSPRSVRSAGPRYRSSSIDSQSSTDSRFYKRIRRKRRSRMNSDNESELSKGSEKSHRKHRRHRSRGHKGDSGSEVDSQHSQRRKSVVDSKLSLSHYELVDSCSQWLEVQRKQAEEGVSTSIHLANVVSNNRLVGNEYEPSHSRNRRHRKRRSYSRSPSEGKVWMPDEFRKHLEFDLIDTTGMSDTQLKEIPYTVVQTSQVKQPPKLRYKNKNDFLKPANNSPPPPYSQNIDNCEIRSKRDMPLQYPQLAGDLAPKNNSSVTSAANSYAQNNPTKYLSSMLESLGISYKYSQHSSHNNGNKERTLNPNSFRVNHEHTDSGLGGEQECTCGSDRYPSISIN